MCEYIYTNLSQSDKIVHIQPVGVSYTSTYKPGQVVGDGKINVSSFLRHQTARDCWCILISQ